MKANWPPAKENFEGERVAFSGLFRGQDRKETHMWCQPIVVSCGLLKISEKYAQMQFYTLSETEMHSF